MRSFDSLLPADYLSAAQSHAPQAPEASCPAASRREIVIPVRNEERDLGPSVRRLHAFLREEFPFTARITIADNASDDGTWSRALALETELDGVRAVRLERPGRGGALRSVWSHSDAAIFAYMDVDLSTDLNALLPLLAPLLSGHSDVAIGTRLARGARVIRGPRREVISRCYNLLLHASLGTGFSDAQCGFKAIRADAARVLLPLTTDTAWFFDTELLVLAERAGLRIAEVPVDWIDDADSRVKLMATAVADLRGIVRLGTGLARGTIKVPALGDPSPPGLAGGVAGRCSVTRGARIARRRRRPGPAARPAGVPAGAVRPGWRGLHGGLRSAVSVLAWCWVRSGRTRSSLLVTAVAEYGGEPAGDVRDPGPGASGAASGARADRVRDRAGADVRGRWRCCTTPTPGRAGSPR